MLRIDKVIKPWKEAAALNDHINLYGQWSKATFLTKSGDVGIVLRVGGVDYESLDRGAQEYAVKRLEAALKSFGPGFHIYQYLFKSNRPEIPFASYDDPVVQTEVNHRREFFSSKRDSLYQIEIFYCVLLRPAQARRGLWTALSQLLANPLRAFSELKVQFSSNGTKILLRSEIESARALLDQRVAAFARQLGDLVPIEVLDERGQFRFFRRLLNFDDWRIAGSPKAAQ